MPLEKRASQHGANKENEDPGVAHVKGTKTNTGVEKLFGEIFVETSSGDIGLQVKDGPLLRCHSVALGRVPGFLSQLRAKLRPLPLYIEKQPLNTMAWLKKRGHRRIAEQIQFASFAEDRYTGGTDVVLKGGWSTCDPMSGTKCGFQRKDPLRLAERYELSEDVERAVELLRFVYLDQIEFMSMKPDTEEAKGRLLSQMVDMLFLANRFAVDQLFARLMRWFPTHCRAVCGDRAFCDAYYKIQYYYQFSVEEPLFRNLMKQTLVGMGCVRTNFQLLSWDDRWTSLPPSFLQLVLDHDDLAVTSEAEVLVLIERWNANRDKDAEEIYEICCCYRQTAENVEALVFFLSNLGLLEQTGAAKGKEKKIDESMYDNKEDAIRAGQLAKLFAVLPRRNTKPRRGKTEKKNRKQAEAVNRSDTAQVLDDDLAGADDDLAVAFSQVEQSNQVVEVEVEDEDLDAFMLVKKDADTGKFFGGQRGLGFTVVAGETMTQLCPIRDAGQYRIRVAMSQKLAQLWIPNHSCFVGVVYNEHCFCGYQVQASDFLGIYELRCMTSVSAKPEKPVFLTGSGTKVDFDLDLTVDMKLVNGVIGCRFSIIANSITLTMDEIQVSNKCMQDGGLRFQIVPMGLDHKEQMDIRITWIMGNGNLRAA
mmetsp:Transcript_9869/g.24393  ORF Transcript_9869/g.24393 Transcript_9869/m.24393 type:complete len:647 (+) Transcript_9869:534-2474(+)|eukprot:CAMPEP_0178996544 /NCGR_PEP_ID=MMETSP0795-20121207/8422_1 /TAXON_ID=88552 /ORGANISM="Amoebophrya sp., Strain Ameob2" /LENGTH=646 /DNA_ID=CAMNT_0020688935 /DNA_START=458 /DNA_END=2398 /DNA_ORIENTATION=-